MQEFTVLGQICEFCKSRYGCKKLKTLTMNPNESYEGYKYNKMRQSIRFDALILYRFLVQLFQQAAVC